MSDVIIPIDNTKAIKNGSMVVYQTEAGTESTVKRDPDLNSFVPSGTLVTRYQDRMDEARYYTGDSPTDV
tara:strand:+ start:843 stop:1052 length:210 start_codon:yes stop_codon:yes gene_type:complete